MTAPTDRIVKTTVVNAPLERVWAAVSDAAQFGAWFGAAFDGPFVAGTRVEGHIVPTTVDAAVAALQEPHAGRAFAVYVERVEPPRTLSFRWHPFTAAEGESAAPTTLVTFTLDAVADGTRITVVESGFDDIPLEQRAQAFEANTEGWAHQLRLVATYLGKTA